MIVVVTTDPDRLHDTLRAAALHSPIELRKSSALDREGTSAHARRSLRHGTLVRVRRGVFVDARSWQDAFPEARMRTAALALLESARGAPIVFSHETAAALWRLPLFRRWMHRVHVVQSASSAPSTPLVFRHRDRLAPEDIVWLDDAGRIGVTSLERTAFDLSCALPEESGVGLLDAALRLVSLTPGTRLVDREAAEHARAAITERIFRASGRRGIRRARFVVAFADPRAELPGESVSRLYLSWLGFPPPDLQVAVAAPSGRDYAVDFGFPTWWGEFDGQAKYTDPDLLGDRTPEQVLQRQNAREDWICSRTRKPMIRWGMAQIATHETLRAHLAAFGIHPATA